jgi:hypothetical protein
MHGKQDLDERVAQARREAEVSRERLQHAREHVIRPLERRADTNHFAELLRQSLTGGQT